MRIDCAELLDILHFLCDGNCEKRVFCPELASLEVLGSTWNQHEKLASSLAFPRVTALGFRFLIRPPRCPEVIQLS